MSSQLAQFLEDRADTVHRGTVRDEADGIEFLHLREDLNEDRLRDQIEGILARLQPEGTEEEDLASFHLGSLEARGREERSSFAPIPSSLTSPHSVK